MVLSLIHGNNMILFNPYFSINTVDQKFCILVGQLLQIIIHFFIKA